jgi:hypothetical protein
MFEHRLSLRLSRHSERLHRHPLLREFAATEPVLITRIYLDTPEYDLQNLGYRLHLCGKRNFLPLSCQYYRDASKLSQKNCPKKQHIVKTSATVPNKSKKRKRIVTTYPTPIFIKKTAHR